MKEYEIHKKLKREIDLLHQKYLNLKVHEAVKKFNQIGVKDENR